MCSLDLSLCPTQFNISILSLYTLLSNDGVAVGICIYYEDILQQINYNQAVTHPISPCVFQLAPSIKP